MGACEELGAAVFIRRCLNLLGGGSEKPAFVVTLGGAAARGLLDAGVPDEQAYWLRVWAARGLLWAGPGEDSDALRAALDDDAWRVREMVCRVIARHRVGDLLDRVGQLDSDPVPRVRGAAARAARSIITARA